MAIGATLARTDTWTGVFELRIDGIPILIITVIPTVAITLVCICWFQRHQPVPDPAEEHRTHRNTEQEKIDEKVQAVRMLTGGDFYATLSGHHIHLSLACESVLNPSTARPFKFCQLCIGGT